ncbi:MAG: TetR/AcrR family transcriptional regulator [Pikeienuella sp.]
MSAAPDANATTPDQPRADTRMTLILTAERIFAEEGISNTPLRRVTRAAGQRNESAIHYHFGSREGVVGAILEHRTSPINQARIRFLNRLRAATEGPLSSRDVAESLCGPLAEHLRNSGGESYDMRFLGALWLDQPMWRSFEGRGAEDMGLFMGLDALLESKPYLPRSVVRLRYRLAIQISTYSMARLERIACKHGPDFDWMRAEADIAGIVDALTAIFDAPISSPSVEALRAAGAFGASGRDADAP